MPLREIATISIYPAPGRSHAPERHLSAMGAYTRSLLHALPSDERIRHIVLTNLKQDGRRVFDDNGIEVREVWTKESQRFAWQIIRAIKSLPGLELIHLQHEFNQFGGVLTVPMIPLLLLIIRFVMKRKVMITYHEVAGRAMLNPDLAKHYQLPVPVFSARYLFKWYYRMTSFAANEILVQHSQLRDILRDEMGIGKPIQILPHGTEDHLVPADRTLSRRKYGLGTGERVLLFFGTLDWRKGLDVLIGAFERLPPGYRLLIAGGQPVRIRHRPKYRAWHADLEASIGKNPAISLIGFVPDVDIPMLFAAADLVILPYLLPQAVSAVMSYAASYERPFICSQAFSGSIDPLVLFVAEAEPLAKKIQWCFDDHEQELLEYARTYKRENSWARSAAILARRYSQVIDSRLRERPGPGGSPRK